MSVQGTADRKERIAKAVYAAIDALNEQLPEWQVVAKSRDTVLLGWNGKLDSVGFINLIVLLEEKCQEECGITLSLSDSDPSSQPSPFETVDTLIDYLERQIERSLEKDSA